MRVGGEVPAETQISGEAGDSVVSLNQSRVGGSRQASEENPAVLDGTD